MSQTDAPTHHLTLSRDASVFLDMIVEMGHFDEAALDRLNDLLLEGQVPGGIVDLQGVRRAVAIVLMDSQDRMPEEAQRTLNIEWPLLLH